MSHYYLLRSRSERLALAFHRTTSWRVMCLLCILAFAVLGYLCLGSTLLTPPQVIQAIIAPSDSDHGFTVYTLRLPRALLAMEVGAALGISGVILQQVVRNPLASPDIIGISDGAAFGAVLFLAIFAGVISIHWLPVFALTGAGLTALLIYALARNNGIIPIRLVLVGIAIAAALKAVATLTIVMSDLNTTVSTYVWLTGSLYGAQWQDVIGMLPWLIILLPLSIVMARPLALMGMNDQQALGLGAAVNRNRLLLLAGSVALAGSAVAFAGGIGFVGLIAPHLARGICGQTMPGRILGSGLTGALIVLVADLIGRIGFLPQDLPAGIFVSAIGAPFFIYLLYRRRR
ncbi:FecCD family ABC transporter permease [Gynuella sunshinyii]|uniref:ABC-type Fe3+-siderophore transport system, permease component n=1 Tax=Gynuella sunshinyii YC6258 TaxID=1445510 RepID=A0A0C5VLU9_9GAMM|nr:iron ABC transporter permease [Gynuella sunshinyii]AJQ94323.1 ABC-type Fe3+-siderophore transport system, permease component [Gynuella sunshinyii YC6258]